MNTDKKLDMIIEMVAHMNEQMTMQFGEMGEKIENFRAENVREHELLNSQIASLTEMLQHNIAENDARYKELKANDEELKRVQRLHSADIAELRAAI